MNVQQISSLIYGTYTGLVYATPLLGGWIADRYLGQRHTVLIGIVLMAFGHFMMASERLSVSRLAPADPGRRLVQDQHLGPGGHAL